MHTEKWVLALKCVFTVQLSSLLKSPSPNLTYLGAVLIYVSEEEAVYLANEDYPPPCPLLHVYRAERFSRVNFSPDCLHDGGYISETLLKIREFQEFCLDAEFRL